ncbi:hypothetical protein CSKR_101708 [Clonorchis sinensis]|uniref:Uncharacterized protein n=1 Tax=Clonorchis sinensis TaxID=79923 RepID=A0A8T1MNY5_CLOSI|nr:hypothetical protein CSKR_101708 [Clonorchis sinensis]
MTAAEFYDEIQGFYATIHSCRERRRQLVKEQSEIWFANLSRTKTSVQNTRQAQRWANHKRLEFLHSRLVECERRMKMLYDRIEMSKSVNLTPICNNGLSTLKKLSLSDELLTNGCDELRTERETADGLNQEGKIPQDKKGAGSFCKTFSYSELPAARPQVEHPKKPSVETSENFQEDCEQYSEILQQSSKHLIAHPHTGEALLRVPRMTPQLNVGKAAAIKVFDEPDIKSVTASERSKPDTSVLQSQDRDHWDAKDRVSETDNDFTMSGFLSYSHNSPSCAEKNKVPTIAMSGPKTSTATQISATNHTATEEDKPIFIAEDMESRHARLSPGLVRCANETLFTNLLTENLDLDNTSQSSTTLVLPREKQMGYQNVLLKALGPDIKDVSSAGEQTEEIEFGEAILRQSTENSGFSRPDEPEKPKEVPQTKPRLLSAYLNGCDSEEDSFYD